MEGDPAAVSLACWRVSGQVQGVGFRWFVQRAAAALGIHGDVCNLPDGRVEIRAAGAAAALERLLEAVRQGPPSAEVDRIEVLAPQEDLPREGFHVRYGARR